MYNSMESFTITSRELNCLKFGLLYSIQYNQIPSSVVLHRVDIGLTKSWLKGKVDILQANKLSVRALQLEWCKVYRIPNFTQLGCCEV